MKKRFTTGALLTLTSATLVMGGVLTARTNHVSVAHAESSLGKNYIEVGTGSELAQSVNNAYDGAYIKLTCNIELKDTFSVPTNSLVTIDLNGYTVYYVSNKADNIGVKESSALIMQNGTWSGTIDTDNYDSGTIVLNNLKQVLPEGEDDLNKEGNDCNAKGVVFCGNTKMWIVNNCEIHRIATEQGAINPGADSLNPWASGHKDPTIAEENVALKCPYNFENSAPALVGSGVTWEVYPTVSEAFAKTQIGGDVYKNVILLKDATLDNSADLNVGGKIFDLSGHTLNTNELDLSLSHDEGTNIVRNGCINGDFSSTVGTGEIELKDIDLTGTLHNSAHPVTVSGGHYSTIETTTGNVTLKTGFFSGDYISSKFTMASGYYVNQPANNQVYLGSEPASCEIAEKGVTYNYQIVETQPNMENDYTVALNADSFNATFKWYRNITRIYQVDSSYVVYAEAGTFNKDGTISQVSEDGENGFFIELDGEKLGGATAITFKTTANATTIYEDYGTVESLGNNRYKYTFGDLECPVFAAFTDDVKAPIYDIEYEVAGVVQLDAETGPRIQSVISNDYGEYSCETYLDGELIKTSNTIKTTAVKFNCAADGATGEDPAAIYQLPGRTITLPANPYTKSCFKFDGWRYNGQKIEGDTFTALSTDAQISAFFVQGEHPISDTWSYDEYLHWRAATCEHTDVMSNLGVHQWNAGEVTVQPTEQSKGKMTYTCTVCGATKDETLDVLTHEKGQHHDAHEPTCTVEGNVEYWDCKNCSSKLDADGNVLETTSVPATGHNIGGDYEHDPESHWQTCQNEGCTVTGVHNTHTWDTGVVTKQPTEEATGVKTFTCTVCGETKTQPIAKLTHEKGEHHNANNATCTTEGNVEYWDCKNCSSKLDAEGNVIESVIIEKVDHHFGEDFEHNADGHWHVCTNDGCTAESEHQGHNWISSITTEPTEDAYGVRTYTCLTCGETKTEQVAKLTHEKGQHHDANNATCTTDGNVEYWDCKNCSNKLDADGKVIENVTIPATGHNISGTYEHDAEGHWQTCQNDGCSVTGVHNTHTWDSGVVTTEPTESSKGVKTFTCTVCGETKTQEIAQLTHEKGQHHDAKAATCTTDGNVEYWDCKNCGGKLDASGNVITNVVVPATGHDYSGDYEHDANGHWKTCTHAGCTEKSSEGAHEWNSGVVTTEPTETSKGVKTYTCSTCGATKTEEIAALTHEKGTHHEGVEATCTENGTVEYWECCNCGEKLDAEGNPIETISIPATGHNVIKHDGVNPTTGEAGSKEYYECTCCNEYFEDAECKVKIGNITEWKQENGGGYIAPIPETKQSLNWLWILLLILIILVAAYTGGYFFGYREGRLDDKSIRVIYKLLPRGEKNLAKPNANNKN